MSDIIKNEEVAPLTEAEIEADRARSEQFKRMADMLVQTAEPLIRLLRENYNPYYSVIVGFDRVDLICAQMGVPFEYTEDEPEAE